MNLVNVGVIPLKPINYLPISKPKKLNFFKRPEKLKSEQLSMILKDIMQKDVPNWSKLG